MSKDLNIDEIKRSLEKAKRGTKDIHLGGDPEPEKTPLQVEAAEAHEENEQERIARLIERNAELERELSLVEDEKRLRRKWVDGDYRDLPADHPFEVLVHTDTSGQDPNPMIEPEINGQRYPIVRGMPTKVPHAVVKLLSQLKYDFVTKEVGPQGYPIAVLNKGLRFPYSAHPVY